MLVRGQPSKDKNSLTGGVSVRRTPPRLTKGLKRWDGREQKNDFLLVLTRREKKAGNRPGPGPASLDWPTASPLNDQGVE